MKTNLKGEIIELAGIDSVSRNIDLKIKNRKYDFMASPNTTYTFNDQVEIGKEVQFDYPYIE